MFFVDHHPTYDPHIYVWFWTINIGELELLMEIANKNWFYSSCSWEEDFKDISYAMCIINKVIACHFEDENLNFKIYRTMVLLTRILYNCLKNFLPVGTNKLLRLGWLKVKTNSTCIFFCKLETKKKGT